LKADIYFSTVLNISNIRRETDVDHSFGYELSTIGQSSSVATPPAEGKLASLRTTNIDLPPNAKVFPSVVPVVGRGVVNFTPVMNEAESTAINALLGMMQGHGAADLAGNTKGRDSGSEFESSLKRRIATTERDIVHTSALSDGKDIATRPNKRIRTKKTPMLPFAANVGHAKLTVLPRVVQVCVVQKSQVDQ
jgi:hypothetical protein